jgi:hypothetical protein
VIGWLHLNFSAGGLSLQLTTSNIFGLVVKQRRLSSAVSTDSIGFVESCLPVGALSSSPRLKYFRTSGKGHACGLLVQRICYEHRMNWLVIYTDL